MRCILNDLVNEIQTYLEKSNSETQKLPTIVLYWAKCWRKLYSVWWQQMGPSVLVCNWWSGRGNYRGLEETDEDDIPKSRKKKRVNAFMDGDEDAIDYSDDDPEDEDS